MRDVLYLVAGAAVAFFVVVPLMNRRAGAVAAQPYRAPRYSYPFFDQSAREAQADTVAAIRQVREFGVPVTAIDLEDAELGIAMRRAAGQL
jgi:hypothetical protein